MLGHYPQSHSYTLVISLDGVLLSETILVVGALEVEGSSVVVEA